MRVKVPTLINSVYYLNDPFDLDLGFPDQFFCFLLLLLDPEGLVPVTCDGLLNLLGVASYLVQVQVLRLFLLLKI